MTHPIHYGGDSGTGHERAGPLYFYDNTFVLRRNQQEGWKFEIFDVTSKTATIDVRDNIFADFRARQAPRQSKWIFRGNGEFCLWSELGFAWMAYSLYELDGLCRDRDWNFQFYLSVLE